MTPATDTSLLSEFDPPPVEIVNEASRTPILLLCEHAGHAIPRSLKSLGLQKQEINSHRGWDIGAAAVARGIAGYLSAPLIIQNYSRLVIDTNRPPNGPHAIPQEVDGGPIPGNAAITPADQRKRAEEIFQPMDSAVKSLFDACDRIACFSIHSFTPVFEGKQRPWDAGFLSRQDRISAHGLMAAINQRHPELILALDQPYQIDDETDWFIPRHAEPRRIAHSLIEIRNDNIHTIDGSAFWASLLSKAISEVVEKLL